MKLLLAGSNLEIFHWTGQNTFQRPSTLPSPLPLHRPIKPEGWIDVFPVWRRATEGRRGTGTDLFPTGRNLNQQQFLPARETETRPSFWAQARIFKIHSLEGNMILRDWEGQMTTKQHNNLSWTQSHIQKEKIRKHVGSWIISIIFLKKKHHRSRLKEEKIINRKSINEKKNINWKEKNSQNNAKGNKDNGKIKCQGKMRKYFKCTSAQEIK